MDDSIELAEYRNIDPQGRIVLPRGMLDRLGWTPGVTAVRIVFAGGDELRIAVVAHHPERVHPERVVAARQQRQAAAIGPQDTDPDRPGFPPLTQPGSPTPGSPTPDLRKDRAPSSRKDRALPVPTDRCHNCGARAPTTRNKLCRQCGHKMRSR